MAIAIADLDFVDEPPARLRALPGEGPTTARAVGRPMRVTETGDRYVAPDSRRAHGTHVKYVIEKCRCLDCTVASREYEKSRRRRHRRPDEAFVAYVDATPARRHLREMAALGIGYKEVARAVGIPHQTLQKLLYGGRRQSGRKARPSRRVRPATADAVLSFRPAMAAGGQKIPAGPTWRLLDDLVARGFYKAWIAQQITGNPRAQALQVARGRVLASTARAVEDLHRRCAGMTPPPKRTRWREDAVR